MRYTVHAPRINVQLAPKEERLAVYLVRDSLDRLASYVGDFEAALALFDLVYLPGKVQDRDMRLKWKFMAAETGATVMYNVHHILTNSGQTFRDCPVFRKLLDHNAFSAARKFFSDKFPNITRVRHGAQHSAEITSTTANFTRNALSGSIYEPGFLALESAQHVMVTRNFLERKYCITHQGKLVSYKVSEESLQTLAEIIQLYFSGFAQVH